VVRRDSHLDRLPEAHLLALRLDGAGADHSVIARVLDIEPKAAGPLLDIARRKAGIPTAGSDHKSAAAITGRRH
jgi:hypothetical protein